MTDLELIREQLLGIITRVENVIAHVEVAIAEAPEPEPEPATPPVPVTGKLAFLGSDDPLA